MNLGALIKENLWAIICLGMTSLLGFVVGSTNMKNSLESLQGRVTTLEGRMDAAATYDMCSTRHFDQIGRAHV